MDDLSSDLAEIKTDLSTVSKDVNAMKPVTDEVRRWKLMGMGALGVVGIGGTALGVALAGSLEWLAKFFRGGG